MNRPQISSVTRLLALGALASLALAGAASAAAVDPEPITFYADVAPVLQQECQVCHRPNGANLGGMVAPMALTTYEETRPWARSIARQVASRAMPPWDAAPQHNGVFSNERTLTQEQIDLLVNWAESGAPAGDPADAPEPVEWPSSDGWLIGEPDLVLQFDEPYFVEDDVEDLYIYFQTTVTEEMIPEDRYVKAIEFRPGSPAVHHIIVPGLGGIAPGNDPVIHTDGMADVLKAGRNLRWQMHYHKEPGPGTGSWDQSSVALKFYDKDEEVKYEVFNADLGKYDFVVPPGDSDYTIQTEWTFPSDSEIVGYLPHMHLRGKAAKYEAYYPDGGHEVLLDVPNYDFNWQTTYKYRDRKKVPAGTRVVLTTVFDNSEDNPANPDPTAAVRWGEPTTDEMSFGFMSYINEENKGRGAFQGGGQGIDVTAIVALSDDSRDGKMQLEEAPGGIKQYFEMMDQNKDGAVDMEEAKAANAFLQQMAEQREKAEAAAAGAAGGE
ncbi:MAG: alkyl hydroperoxide reductase [Holophagales bacterium]|nr:alkyl hydroperoxide reductase [Holophagales bacterium]MYF96641.1 alkyl hydroperoxide reductase [Holophagales bacterium]